MENCTIQCCCRCGEYAKTNNNKPRWIYHNCHVFYQEMLINTMHKLCSYIISVWDLATHCRIRRHPLRDFLFSSWFPSTPNQEFMTEKYMQKSFHPSKWNVMDVQLLVWGSGGWWIDVDVIFKQLNVGVCLQLLSALGWILWNSLPKGSVKNEVKSESSTCYCPFPTALVFI